MGREIASRVLPGFLYIKVVVGKESSGDFLQTGSISQLEGSSSKRPLPGVRTFEPLKLVPSPS